MLNKELCLPRTSSFLAECELTLRTSKIVTITFYMRITGTRSSTSHRAPLKVRSKWYAVTAVTTLWTGSSVAVVHA